MSLYLKILEDESRQTLEKDHRLFPRETFLPDLSDNIKCGNSLIGLDSLDEIGSDEVTRGRVNPFNWEHEFKGVMKVGGFDAVIGNPPYVRIQTMREWAPYEADYLKRHYALAAKGSFDIYVTFIEKGLNLLNQQGRFGMILPHKFLNSQYGAPARRLITSGKHLSEIVHFGDQQVFEKGTTYTCLLFLMKIGSDELKFAQVDDLEAWRYTGVCTADGKFRNDRLTEKEWNFMVGPGGSVAERLSNTVLKLGDIADVFVGLQTSADNVFVMDFISEGARTIRLRSKALASEWVFENDLLFPLVSGTDVIRYGHLPQRQYILFPYDVGDSVDLIAFRTLKKNFPRTAEYLLKNRRKLEAREKGKFKDSQWYRFGRNQNLGIQNRKKICVPRLVRNLKLTLDEDGSHFLDNVDVCGVTPKSSFNYIDKKFLLGILNSRLMRFYFPYISAPFRGGWRSANRQFLSQLPMCNFLSKPSSQDKRADRIVTFVDRMLDLVLKEAATASEAERTALQRAMKETDRQIDALVYELYALTDAEIAVVETETAG